MVLLRTIFTSHTICPRVLSKCFWNSVRLSAVTLPCGASSVPNLPLGKEHFLIRNTTPPNTTSGHSCGCCHRSPQKRDQCLPLLFPSQGSHRLHWNECFYFITVSQEAFSHWPKLKVPMPNTEMWLKCYDVESQGVPTVSDFISASNYSASYQVT